MNRLQIAKNAEYKVQAKKLYEVEGQLIREQELAAKRKIERIKGEKLKELQTLGIPGKYRVDLAKKKIR